MGRWNLVAGMADRFNNFGTSSGSGITHGDGRFDAAVVNSSDIGNNNGLTKVFWNVSCNTIIRRKIIEADVMVAAHLAFGNPSESTLVTTGRGTFVHEFGHALGLKHFQGFNMMRATQPRPLFGGPGEHIDILPDDAAGGRALYPVSGTHRNLLSTAHRRNPSNDTILLNQLGTVFACSGGGGSLGVNATVANNGNVNITQTERWFVSTNSTAYGGTQVFQWAGSTYNAGSAITVLRTFTLPALSVGTYRLFHAVDALNQHSETREDDNVAREALIIEVISC
jgi:hypothetical protein